MAETKESPKGEVLTLAHIEKRNAEAAKKVAASRPAGILPGDWQAVQKTIADLEARVAALEHPKK